MCTRLHKHRYVFGFIVLLIFWFLTLLSSQPHASWELTILFGELSKSFKTVFKSCNSTFVLLQLRTCQASSMHLDFSSAKWSKISIFCMKLPVFCMGVYTSSAPSALSRLQLVFPWVRKLGPEEEAFSCLRWKSHPWGKVKRKVKSLGHVQLFATPWTVAYRAPPSMGFSRQRYWSGLPLPSPEDLPDTGIEPRSTCIAGRHFILWATREAIHGETEFKVRTMNSYLECFFLEKFPWESLQLVGVQSNVYAQPILLKV